MLAAGIIIMAGLDGSFSPVVARNSDVCHRGCAYAVLQAVQRPGVRSAVYGIMHYKEPLKSFYKSRV